MNKRIQFAILLALLLIGAAAVIMIQQRNRDLESLQNNDKRLPGNSMTEQAVDNAMSGRDPMDKQNLPDNTQPKANNIQGSDAMQGSVIYEGSAELK
jgi:hypothetical protein